MKLFVESTVIVDYLNGVPAADRVVETADEVLTSALCAFEALVGEKIKMQKNRASKIEKAESFFQDIGAVPFTLNDSKLASDIYARMAHKGSTVNTMDVLIAAQAVNRGLTVATKDKDFEVISKFVELKLELLK
ncbi:type II toxin-antitoxin system VapC family toxin [Candidatus Marsarchaeota archaeon]|jgi:predicted nucleic acid-binding protein|nr:type II toxin-antitoxin system VapC family toxin [Candidatus Marsarchaeota archaeon]MCL5115458.1 type II toxin-antitoxin system VapC family toxin [Candidatus Marsarchaeota archaeon]